ncbi:MAG: T9SS type A sorting domain-containing protein [Crocinitomicaceae bacterium]|nr:T9SS type A sorting domain-containing protein [Crocinitomicaceae bacterium]
MHKVIIFCWCFILSQTSWGQFGLPTGLNVTFSYPTEGELVDWDDDGDLDIVVVSSKDSKISWFENYGLGNFSEQTSLVEDVLDVYRVDILDVDSDGDKDIICSSTSSGPYFYENLGNGVLGSQIAMSGLVSGYLHAEAADFDGDNINELIISGSNDITSYEYMGNGVLDTAITFTTLVSIVKDFDTLDIDLDGDLDIVSISYNDDKIAWYENDGLGNFGPQIIISTAFIAPRNLIIADINMDSLVDIVVSNFSSIIYLENLGGGSFSSPINIANSLAAIPSIYVTDLDNDSDNDIVTGEAGNGPSEQSVVIFRNQGDGSFDPIEYVTGQIWKLTDVLAEDLLNNGWHDIVTISNLDQKAAWCFSLGDTIFNPPNELTNHLNQAYGSHNAILEDMDQDGDLDILFESFLTYTILWGKIGWYENDGSGNFGLEYIELVDTMLGSSFIEYIDLNNDGLKDIVWHNSQTNEIFWRENLGSGNYNIGLPILSLVNSPTAICPMDRELDGDIDFLVCSSNELKWYTNYGNLTFWGPNIIDSSTGLNYLDDIDIDMDGDLDIICFNYSTDMITWYERLSPTNFNQEQVLINMVINNGRIKPEDIDMDGDKDIIYFVGSSGVYVVENLGQGNFSSSQLINANGTVNDVTCGDVDQDGVKDVVYGRGDNSQFVWRKNNGNFSFGPENIIYVDEFFMRGPNHVELGDLNGNGVKDLVGFSHAGRTNVAVFENQSCPNLSVSLQSVEICPADSIIIFGAYQTQQGIYYDTLQAVSGCDSILQQELIISSTQPIDQGAVNICIGDSAVIFGNYVSTSGIYYDSLQSNLGCDSILMAELIVHSGSTAVLPNLDFCQNDSILIFGGYESSPGLYYDTLQSIYGCDSILSQELVLHFSDTIYLGQNQICQYDSALIFGNYQSSPGLYYDTLQTVYGCDSVLSQELIVNPLPSVSMDQLASDTICEYMPPYNLTGTPFGGTFLGPGVIGNIFYPSIPSWGEHTLYYLYTDGNGCEATDSVKIWVDACLDVGSDIFPNLTIYPNPFTDFTTISFGRILNGGYNIKIYDALGQEVYVKKYVTGTQLLIQKEQLGTGVYLFSIFNNSTKEKVYITRLIVE